MGILVLMDVSIWWRCCGVSEERDGFSSSIYMVAYFFICFLCL